MTCETAILRAYALASQCRTAEAEALLKSFPESLNTIHGKDLLARIKYESGDEAAARLLWEEILKLDPSNDEAKNAIGAIGHPEQFESDGCSCGRKCKIVLCVALLISMGLGIVIGRLTTAPTQPPPSPAIPSGSTLAEFQADKIDPTTIERFKSEFLPAAGTNSYVVLSGGAGKDAITRKNRLAALAEGVVVFYKLLPWERLYIDLSPSEDQLYRFRAISK